MAIALASLLPARTPLKSRHQASLHDLDDLPASIDNGNPCHRTVKSATQTRLVHSLLAVFLFLVALVFLILVEIGNILPTAPVVGTIFFLKLDVSYVIP